MSDIAFHIRQFVPTAEGVELEYRAALLKARDYAAASRGRAESSLAYDLACAAHEVAGEFLFADVSVPRLDLSVKLCRHLVSAAHLAEFLDEPRGTI